MKIGATCAFFYDAIKSVQGVGTQPVGMARYRTGMLDDRHAHFLKRGAEIHNNKYDYSKVVYVNASTKVIIICPTHGDFEQIPGTHINGSGCRKCGLESQKKRTINNAGGKKTQEEFLKQAKEKHGDRYDYTKTVYVGATTNVTIICKKHGDFLQTPHSHLRGSGCNQCGNENIAKLASKSHEQFIEEVTAFHNGKYDYSKTNYVKNNIPITIICPHHGEFTQMPSAHLIGGCVKCGNEITCSYVRLSQSDFINKAIEKHGNKYNYNKVVYVSSNEKVIITCLDHGDFLQVPSSHMQGIGCPTCGINKRNKSLVLPTEEFITRANILHNNKYKYDKVIYKRSLEKVIITCNTHGDFEQTPNSHLSGQGCSRCGHEFSSNARRLTTEEFIRRANNIHDNRYIYDAVVYHDIYTHVDIKCTTHGVFRQSPVSHLSGRGCRKCNAGTSKISLEWLGMLIYTYPNLITIESKDGEYRIPGTSYHADGYCPDTNTIFEFHGDYWHGNPVRYPSERYNATTNCTMGELYEKTQQKRQVCEALGYRYVEVWESEWNTLKRVLRKRLRMKA